MPPAAKEKTKFDRVKETITILKKMIEFGISDENDGYLQAKQALDEWIKTGEEAEHLISLRTYKKNLILSLYSRADKPAQAILRAQ